MVEWYDMLGALDDLESHPAYLEKLAVTRQMLRRRELSAHPLSCSPQLKGSTALRLSVWRYHVSALGHFMPIAVQKSGGWSVAAAF